MSVFCLFSSSAFDIIYITLHFIILYVLIIHHAFLLVNLTQVLSYKFYEFFKNPYISQATCSTTESFLMDCNLIFALLAYNVLQKGVKPTQSVDLPNLNKKFKLYGYLVKMFLRILLAFPFLLIFLLSFYSIILAETVTAGIYLLNRAIME